MSAQQADEVQSATGSFHDGTSAAGASVAHVQAMGFAEGTGSGIRASKRLRAVGSPEHGPRLSA